MPVLRRRPQDKNMARARRELAIRGLIWAAAVGVLGLVFLLYAQPDLVVQLSNHLWACF